MSTIKVSIVLVLVNFFLSSLSTKVEILLMLKVFINNCFHLFFLLISLSSINSHHLQQNSGIMGSSSMFSRGEANSQFSLANFQCCHVQLYCELFSSIENCQRRDKRKSWKNGWLLCRCFIDREHSFDNWKC